MNKDTVIGIGVGVLIGWLLWRRRGLAGLMFAGAGAVGTGAAAGGSGGCCGGCAGTASNATGIGNYSQGSGPNPPPNY